MVLLEMQTVLRADEGLRMRYYQSIIDVEHLNRGESYRNMKESYIIFICLDDPFGDGKPVYNFVTQEEHGGRILNDRIHKVIYNASSFEKAENPAVHAFLKFLKERCASDELTSKIQARVETCTKFNKWESDYMLWRDQVREWQDDAREAGLAEGEKRGREEKAIETARKLLKCNISVEIIAECTGLSMAEISALQEKQA